MDSLRSSRYGGIHCSDVAWAPWCIKSPISRCFVQQLFRLRTKASRLRIVDPFWRKPQSGLQKTTASWDYFHRCSHILLVCCLHNHILGMKLGFIIWYWKNFIHKQKAIRKCNSPPTLVQPILEISWKYVHMFPKSYVSYVSRWWYEPFVVSCQTNPKISWN